VGYECRRDERQEDDRYEKAAAPSVDFADNPAITAIQVRVSVNSIRMPATASHASTPADEESP